MSLNIGYYMGTSDLYDQVEYSVKMGTPLDTSFEACYREKFCLQSDGWNTFLIPNLFWTDDLRNIYRARCHVREGFYHIKGVMLNSAGLYVDEVVTLDGVVSKNLSMIKPENRYKTVFPEILEWELTVGKKCQFATCPHCRALAPYDDSGLPILSKYCPECGKELKKF